MPITNEDVKKLTSEVSELRQQMSRSTIVTWVIATSLAFVIAVIIAFGTLWHSVQVNGDRNKTAQCALMNIFFQLEPNLAKSPNYSNEQKANQTQFFGTLHQIAKDLSCSE